MSQDNETRDEEKKEEQSRSTDPNVSFGSFEYSDDLILEVDEDGTTGEAEVSSQASGDAPQNKQEQQDPEEANVSLPAQINRDAQPDSGGLNTVDNNAFRSMQSPGGPGGETVRKEGRIGDRLIEAGIIDEGQLKVALQEKKISGKMLGNVLVDLGFIDQNILTIFLSESSGFEMFDPQSTVVDGNALSLIDKKIAQKYKVLPISMDEEEVRVAMSDPYDVVTLDMLRRYMPKGVTITPLVATSLVISDAIDAAFGYASSISDIMKELEGEAQHKDVADLDESEAFSHPIVRLVNALVSDAVKIGASDLHFEPEENFIRLRYRIDGVLFTAQTLHKQHWNGISQRLKIMSNLDIADKMSPQDGRFNLNVNGRTTDFRVSSLPTVHGENIVIRILDQASGLMELEDLGFSEENLARIKKAQSKPEGIIIVTGPTGSGKTTSLYSMLNKINTVDVNIQTLEDPVEYSLPMIRQTHVREGVLDFADGIKALLRQDPDIIFVGEIRDKTTAEMALKASMTGHQVYTTLHTNDSFGALPRLFDLGMKPGMLAGAIVAVFAQRLVRKLCPSCKVEYQPDQHECEILGIDPNSGQTIYKESEQGCSTCSGQKYKGRVAVAEILLFDEDMDELVAQNSSKADLKKLALKKGFKTMRDDGMLKVLDGLTSLEALSKVVDITD